MADDAPRLSQLNLVASDFDATVSFYRLLGVEVEDASGGSDRVRHARVRGLGGLTLEFDDLGLARLYNPAWRRPEGSSRTVLGFSLSTREEVDERYAVLTEAGYEGRQPPFDAFWGARYAIPKVTNLLLNRSHPVRSCPRH
jgi:uncharacterized glyoxalase superfamily protein PhnB